MIQALVCVLLLQVQSAASGKYVYVDEGMFWDSAQSYCRTHHTELAPVSGSYDMERLERLAGRDNYFTFIWLGLQRNSTDKEKWIWSGGGSVTTSFWANGQPDNFGGQDYGGIYKFEWHDSSKSYPDPFFCYNVVVVRERKTWEEALDYCREHHSDLASVASETEMLLIQRELEKNATTERVWFGLHFFPGRWLWVDGQPLDYKAWGHDGEPSCPEFSLECGALRVMRSTAEGNGTGRALGSDGTVSTDTLVGFGSSMSPDGDTSLLDVTDKDEDIQNLMWEAENCEERHHFICY